MVNLGRCLVYLLNRHGEVTVAGVGTFRQVSQPAYFDPEAQAFFPAARQYDFSTDMADQGRGDLIVDYIAAQRQVDTATAQSAYRKALATLFSDLEQKGETTLSGLGTLRQDNNELLFEPLAQSPADAMGAHAVEELPVLTPDGSAGTGVPETSEEKIVPDAETGLNPEPVEESNGRGGLGYWWAAIVLVLLLGGLVILKPAEVYTFLSAKGLEIPYLARFVTDKPVEVQVSEPGHNQPGEPFTISGPDSLNVFSELPVTDSLEVAVGEGAATAPLPEAEDLPRVSFEIIVGSFTSMEQAEEFVEEMKHKGITVWAIDSRMPGNRKKVSCASFPTQGEAYRALRDIQKNIEPGAWVARVER